jgi:phage terminase large subunit-like protein
VPASPEGNVIRREWLDLWRLSALPARLVRTVVGVDPSDSGEGDAAGIVATSLTAEGVVVVYRDISEPMTPEAWARAAIELDIDTRASEICVETFSAREATCRS